MASSCFDPSSLIFTSPRPPLFIPPDLDMVSFLFAITCARPFHQRVAIADASTGQSLTFSRLRRHIQTTALCLSLLGVKQHDVVMIVSPNSVDFPVAFFAIISLGAVATTVNPRNTSIEILKQAKDSTAKLILTVPELAEKVSHSGLPIMLINGEPLQKGNPSVKLLSEVMKHASAHQMPPIKIHQTDPAALMYTSGTTGVSKGAILSHRNFIAAALQVNLDADTHQETDLTFLCCVPMFHVYGLCVIVFGQLQKGNTIITMPKFDLIHMLEAVQAYHITNLPLVPPIMVALTKEDVIRKYDLSSVIETTSGAAPVSKETLEEVYQRLKIPDIRRGYGMTEASGRISIAILKTIKKNYATVGPLVSGMEAVVVDPNSGKRLPPNKQGELWVRGPNIMQGYLNNQEATASVLDEDGWLRTGDLVYIDDEGNLFIVGRLKELIKYKGLQVAPAELEALLLTHFEIIDAAVVPIPDDYAGEVPLAYVVRSAGSSLREHDVIQFVEAQVAPYKKVQKVKFVDKIPKTSSGKILRRQLIQQAMSRL